MPALPIPRQILFRQAKKIGCIFFFFLLFIYHIIYNRYFLILIFNVRQSNGDGSFIGFCLSPTPFFFNCFFNFLEFWLQLLNARDMKIQNTYTLEYIQKGWNGFFIFEC